MNQQLFNYLAQQFNITPIDDELRHIQHLANQPLLDLVSRMRTAQRDFYAAKPGTAARIDALQRSKRLEKEVDELIKTATNPKPNTLF